MNHVVSGRAAQPSVDLCLDQPFERGAAPFEQQETAQ